MSERPKAKYTNEDLKIMQNWSLDRKIQVSLTRISEFGLKMENKIYTSFSGGKDSTVLLDLVRRVFPDSPAVFVDTGLEYPELREFVKTVDNVVWLKPEMNFKRVIKECGYPIISKEVSKMVETAKHKPNGRVAQLFDINSDRVREKTKKYGKNWGETYIKYQYLLNAPFKISNRCCDIMKKKPSKQYTKETGTYPFIGTMACESRMRKNGWLQTGCNIFDSDRPKSMPLSFWTEQDILHYIKEFGLEYAPIYGEIKSNERGEYYTTGVDRSGCMFCVFGCHLEKQPNRFQRLKETHPKIWEFCMKPTDKGGLGMKEVLDYINVPYE